MIDFNKDICPEKEIEYIKTSLCYKSDIISSGYPFKSIKDIDRAKFIPLIIKLFDTYFSQYGREFWGAGYYRSYIFLENPNIYIGFILFFGDKFRAELKISQEIQSICYTLFKVDLVSVFPNGLLPSDMDQLHPKNFNYTKFLNWFINVKEDYYHHLTFSKRWLKRKKFEEEGKDIINSLTYWLSQC